MNSSNTVNFDKKPTLKKRTALPTVRLSALLDEAAIAEKRAGFVAKKSVTSFSLILITG